MGRNAMTRSQARLSKIHLGPLRLFVDKVATFDEDAYTKLLTDA